MLMISEFYCAGRLAGTVSICTKFGLPYVANYISRSARRFPNTSIPGCKKACG